MNIEKTVKNLELRGFDVKRFATGAQAAEYLKGACAGHTVGFGESLRAGRALICRRARPSSSGSSSRGRPRHTNSRAEKAR